MDVDLALGTGKEPSGVVEANGGDKRKGPVLVKVEGVNSNKKPKKGQAAAVAKAGSVPKHGAYARLEGKDLVTNVEFVQYVTELPTILGRKHKGEPVGFVSVGKSKSVSKVHAVLDYDASAENFTLEIKGKNGIILCGKFYKSDEEKIVLKPKDPIKIGPLGFYFLPASFNKPRLSYAELAVQVFTEIGHGIPLGTKEICDGIERKYRYYRHLKNDRVTTSLQASLQQALRRSKDFIRAGLVKGKNDKGRTAYFSADDKSERAQKSRENPDNSFVFNVEAMNAEIQERLAKNKEEKIQAMKSEAEST
mmetsp:Transcript_10672/g.17421  ORF Transcript_10672/g.17421 Transcript_10672/m.17421 type:complete len:307 (+) Transcript_10672:132-1052(+)|eukprot:CAMPEP_0203748594 /NCGR_PEP_ID=MMETSP0098-20131031/3438_1 /ASSEMBLY_ACC=CAM_ASM_000208 /TAXON_ID=96639 /ORGANISM=" , Strain NY0313808BC1" /LENGTH=306 /DNA_ID=CAMNT_0050637389 /DNA_START=103 /DNA_END=1023 /DNA_ORIENTATION=+